VPTATAPPEQNSGAEVASQPTPDDSHSAAQVTHLTIAPIALDSAVAVVSYRPVMGKDSHGDAVQLRDKNGNLRWKWLTHATLPGLQTPGIGCGEAGNITLSGHDWGSSGIFVNLKKMQKGDQLICRAADGTTATYTFFVVNEDAAKSDYTIDDLRPGEQRTITLYTCNRTGTERRVFVARLII